MSQAGHTPTPEPPSTPENLPERLMWFHATAKQHPGVLIWVPLVEAAEEIKRLRAAHQPLLEALRSALVAIGIAKAINAVSAEYDFEPVYAEIRAALAAVEQTP